MIELWNDDQLDNMRTGTITFWHRLNYSIVEAGVSLDVSQLAGCKVRSIANAIADGLTETLDSEPVFWFWNPTGWERDQMQQESPMAR